MAKTAYNVPNLLSVAVVAKRLAVCTKTVRRTIERGELRIHRVGRLVRVSEEDLAAYMARGRE